MTNRFALYECFILFHSFESKRCEVSAEAPSFVTAEGEKELQVTGKVWILFFNLLKTFIIKSGIPLLINKDNYVNYDSYIR